MAAIALLFLLVLLCQVAIKGGSTRQQRAKQRSLHVVNEHFSPAANTAMHPSAQPDKVELVVYAIVGVRLTLATRHASLRTITGLAFLIAPFADALLGRAVLERLCNTEGNTTVFTTVTDVEGIGVDFGVFKGSPTHYGYNYVESGFRYNSPRMLQRAQFSPERGETFIEKGVAPKSIYLLEEGPRQDSFYFYRTRTSVFNRITKQEIVALHVDRFPWRLGGAHRDVLLSRWTQRRCGVWEL